MADKNFQDWNQLKNDKQSRQALGTSQSPGQELANRFMYMYDTIKRLFCISDSTRWLNFAQTIRIYTPLSSYIRTRSTYAAK